MSNHGTQDKPAINTHTRGGATVMTVYHLLSEYQLPVKLQINILYNIYPCPVSEEPKESHLGGVWRSNPATQPMIQPIKIYFIGEILLLSLNFFVSFFFTHTHIGLKHTHKYRQAYRHGQGEIGCHVSSAREPLGARCLAQVQLGSSEPGGELTGTSPAQQVHTPYCGPCWT